MKTSARLVLCLSRLRHRVSTINEYTSVSDTHNTRNKCKDSRRMEVDRKVVYRSRRSALRSTGLSSTLQANGHKHKKRQMSYVCQILTNVPKVIRHENGVHQRLSAACVPQRELNAEVIAQVCDQCERAIGRGASLVIRNRRENRRGREADA